jgi:head-tail adaptor
VTAARPPALRRRLVLERSAAAGDGAGGAERTWRLAGLHWAEVRALDGGARAADGVATGRVTHRVTVHGAPHGADSRPVAGDRFREGRRVLRVEAVAEADPSGKFLDCWVEEAALR